MSSEQAWKLLQQTNEWIRFADTKAGALLAASGVLGGTLIKHVPRAADFANRTTSTVLLAIAFGCLSICAILTLSTITPKLRTGEARSLVFFDHIARRYRNSHSSYVSNLKSLISHDNDLTTQLADQIWANSRVARRKFRRVTYASSLFGIALFAAGSALLVERISNA